MKTRKIKFKKLLAIALAAALLAPTGEAEAAKPALNIKKATMTVGRSVKLRVKNNRKKVKWSSSKKKVASVSRRGLVRAKKAGRAKITAKTGRKKYVCLVTVKNRPIPKAVATQPPETPKPTNAPMAYADEVLYWVNVERSKVGAPSLVLDQKLCQAADQRAQELMSLFSHTRPDGTDCFTIFREYGIKYSAAAENIADGRFTPEQVVASWMGSPGHRANILAPEFKALGVGCAKKSRYYWVQLFTDQVNVEMQGGSAASAAPEETQPVVSPTAPPTATSQPEDLSAYAAQVLEIVNTERAAAGVSPLVLDSTLCAAATVRAQEITQEFSHTRPDGTTCFTALDAFGVAYNTAGENIAAGQTSPQLVMNSWMNSPGHRANILESEFGKLGVGIVKTNDGYRYYWVQMFTN